MSKLPVCTCSRGQACALFLFLTLASVPQGAHGIQEAELASQFGLVGEPEGSCRSPSVHREVWESFLAGVTSDIWAVPRDKWVGWSKELASRSPGDGHFLSVPTPVMWQVLYQW